MVSRDDSSARVYIIRISGTDVHLNGWAPAELTNRSNMATMIKIEYPENVDYLTKRFIERWAERQGERFSFVP